MKNTITERQSFLYIEERELNYDVKMKRRYRKKPELLSSWTTEQDIYLIEHNSLDLALLCEKLPYSADEILERKAVLGLIRREWQLKKLHNKES